MDDSDRSLDNKQFLDIYQYHLVYCLINIFATQRFKISCIFTQPYVYANSFSTVPTLGMNSPREIIRISLIIASF